MAVQTPVVTVTERNAVRHGSWLVCPLIGAGIGLLFVAVSGWMVEQEWAPFRGFFRMAQSVPQPWRLIGAVAIGVLLGLVVAVLWSRERLAVDVSADGITFRRTKGSQTVSKSDVADSYVDGKAIVLADAAGDELARERSGVPAQRLRAALTEHGYPFSDTNPHLADYRLWIDGSTELPPGADATLAARRKALRDFEDEKASKLSGDLRRLGVFVREEKREQYWRPASWLRS